MTFVIKTQSTSAFCALICLEILPRSCSLYPTLQGVKANTKLSCDQHSSVLKRKKNLQNKLYPTSEDSKSFSSVPLVYVILNKELLCMTRSQGQDLSREIKHFQLISSREKTVTLFSSKCRQQPIVQQDWGRFLFYFNFPLYYELSNKVTHLLPKLLICFSSKIQHQKLPLTEIWAAPFPKTPPRVEE